MGDFSQIRLGKFAFGIIAIDIETSANRLLKNEVGNELLIRWRN
tara:strand:+ start:818 stop:949 length:132 start_codon:yes stop_codon:yes gene_type:complete